MMENSHQPVMLSECIAALDIKPRGIYIDGTFGRGGHSREITKRLDDGGRLIGIDRDMDAIEYGNLNPALFNNKLTLYHSDFRALHEVLNNLNISLVDGILLDLGVSSPQLDCAERGFSYMADAPLDMRMDRSEGISAYDVVNGYELSELKRILFEYGEERFGARIADAIVKKRALKPIETTLDLVDIIKSAMPASALREKQHPAKRSFQGIRIAVNDELNALSAAVDAAVEVLKPGGRLAVITFHSLEDRIVKSSIKRMANPCICPPELPICGCGRKPIIRQITGKPILPTQKEIEENPRSRSAKFRVAERLDSPLFKK